jgi:hypothetical protein
MGEGKKKRKQREQDQRKERDKAHDHPRLPHADGQASSTDNSTPTASRSRSPRSTASGFATPLSQPEIVTMSSAQSVYDDPWRPIGGYTAPPGQSRTSSSGEPLPRSVYPSVTEMLDTVSTSSHTASSVAAGFSVSTQQPPPYSQTPTPTASADATRNSPLTAAATAATHTARASSSAAASNLADDSMPMDLSDTTPGDGGADSQGFTLAGKRRGGRGRGGRGRGGRGRTVDNNRNAPGAAQPPSGDTVVFIDSISYDIIGIEDVATRLSLAVPDAQVKSISLMPRGGVYIETADAQSTARILDTRNWVARFAFGPRASPHLPGESRNRDNPAFQAAPNTHDDELRCVLHGFPLTCNTASLSAAIGASECTRLSKPGGRSDMLLLKFQDRQRVVDLIATGFKWLCYKFALTAFQRTVGPQPLRCLRCQNYGHPSVKCTAPVPICSRCSGPHYSYDNLCDGPQTDEHGVKLRYCSSCGANWHNTGWKGCPNYKSARQQLQRPVTPGRTFAAATRGSSASQPAPQVLQSPPLNNLQHFPAFGLPTVPSVSSSTSPLPFDFPKFIAQIGAAISKAIAAALTADRQDSNSIAHAAFNAFGTVFPSALQQASPSPELSRRPQHAAATAPPGPADHRTFAPNHV